MPKPNPLGHLQFEASAKLQRLLGRDLMPDDYSAIEELVKNAYDSDATEVVITVRNRGSGMMMVLDNGSGLDLTSFRRVWMWAGYSEKDASRPLPGTGRIQVGEKGIGRFAADRLGEKLTVLTKTGKMAEALSVEFEWGRFANQEDRLSDIKIPYRYTDPVPIGSKSGTLLVIEGLRATWDKMRLATLERRLSHLLNPYDPHQKFRIAIRAPDLGVSLEVDAREVQDADFEWDVMRDRSGQFVVLGRRRVAESWGPWETLADEAAPTKQTEHFGPVKASFFYYEKRPTRAQVHENAPGVNVFRDGLRVEPAGSHEADWLGLLAKRAKRAGHMPLVPNRLFGFVSIGRKANPELKDATNRRAFIETPALQEFQGFLKARLEQFEAQVEHDVSKPRWEASSQRRTEDILRAGQQTLMMLSLGLSHELRQPLQAIQTAAENVADYLRSRGISEPGVVEALAVVGRSVVRMDRHIRFLKDLGSGRNPTTEDIALDLLVAEVHDAFQQQAKAHGIVLTVSGAPGLVVHFNRWAVLMALTNLVRNALEAISLGPPSTKRKIDVLLQAKKDTVLLKVSDTGPGIPELERPRILKRNTISKKGGMGVALVIWRDALRIFGGDLVCESFSDPTVFTITISRRSNHASPSSRR